MTFDTISWHKYDNGDQRYIVVTLPRVKWLERGGDYRPPASMVPPKIDRRKDNRIGVSDEKPSKRGFRPELRSDELSEAEKRAVHLHMSGMTVVAIGVEMNRSTNAVSKLLSRAREKMAASG